MDVRTHKKEGRENGMPVALTLVHCLKDGRVLPHAHGKLHMVSRVEVDVEKGEVRLTFPLSITDVRQFPGEEVIAPFTYDSAEHT
jgi:hypothetical protein